MEYSVAAASSFIGKRLIVSIRHIHASGPDTFTGLWGVIESVQEDGLLLAVEGGVSDTHWMVPPDLDALQAPSAPYYQMDGYDPVTNVDYEAAFAVADDPDLFNTHGSS